VNSRQLSCDPRLNYSSTKHTGLCCVIGAALALAVTESVCVPAQLRNNTMPDTQRILQEDVFDPQAFLAGSGREYGREIQKKSEIFGRATSRHGLLHQKGKSKSPSCPNTARKRSSDFREGQFFGEACLRGGEVTQRNQPCMKVPDHVDNGSAMLAPSVPSEIFSVLHGVLLRRNSRIEDDLITSSSTPAKGGSRACFAAGELRSGNDAKPVAVTLIRKRCGDDRHNRSRVSSS